MGDNSFGTLFSFTSFGESHGPGIGCIVDGVPPRVPLSEEIVQPYLDHLTIVYSINNFSSFG